MKNFIDFETRFWKKVKKTDTCWLWKGATNGSGYGETYFEGRVRVAHRALWEFLYGKFDKKLQLDHLCRNRLCVNPKHLEIVTRKENLRRGLKGILLTHCPQSHLYNKNNTRFDNRNYRYCRACRSEAQRKRRKKLKIIKKIVL